VFLGHHRHAVDAKGRVAVPATFRRDLARGAVISPGPEQRLVIWPETAWNTYVEQLRMASGTGSDQRQYMRSLFARSRPVELDSQGRILLSDEQRGDAGIRERAVFVGVSDVVELVGEERWDREQSEVSGERFTELTDRVPQWGATSAPPSPSA